MSEAKKPLSLVPETSRAQVSIAYLQSPITWPGIKSTISEVSEKTLPGVEVFHHPHGGLEMVHPSGARAFIPYTNVKIASLK